MSAVGGSPSCRLAYGVDGAAPEKFIRSRSRSFRPESVTYVLGIICHPCDRKIPAEVGGPEHRQLEPRRAVDAATRDPQSGLMSRISFKARRGAQRCEAPHALQDAVRGARRCSSSFRISVRAACQLVVWTRPSATSRERRSSSVAHAAATSSSDSSKLESSSSATRARSTRVRRRAPARSSSVDITSV